MTTVKDPDRPHGYKPRKVTVDRLAPGSHLRLDFRMKRSGFGEKPCDVCGGSKGLLVHGLPKRYELHTNTPLAA